MLWAQKQRLGIMNKLRNMFIHADRVNQGLARNKLVSGLCAQYGCTARKACEYIQELLSAEFIEEDAFGLWLKDKSYKQAEISQEKDGTA